MIRPELNIVVAMSRDHLIGQGNSLPWSLPEELQNFKRLTIGGTVVMGKATFLTLSAPLPDRHNIVISRTLDATAGVEVYDSFMAGLAAAIRRQRPIYFIGGESVYRKALAIADQMHISWISGNYAGDTYFPEYNAKEWQKIEERHRTGFIYSRYQRSKCST